MYVLTSGHIILTTTKASTAILCVGLLPINVAMLACVLMSASAEGVCPEGWFGENCMFQCHCSYSPACYYNGSCPQGDVCEFGYFGPACQYIDLCLLACTGDVPSFIVDNNDYTCNPDPDSDSVQMTFQGEFLFQWIRVVVDNPLTLNRLTLLLNQKHPCVNERWFRVSRVAVDVYCDNTDALSVLQVYGDAAASICSIQVSAGRNLALKQRTWQSSHDNTTLSNTSANAVDGFIDEHYPKHYTCSRTRTELNPTWRVKYARPVILSLVVIHVSLGRQMILRQFNLTTENGHNRVNSIYTHDANQTLERTFILLKSTDFITSLKIVALGNQTLELCEVETFGETVCPDKTYGISCGEACKCWGNKSCAVATGFCSSPCVPGRYGFKCSRNCSITCTDGVCRERSGHCYSCKAGYMGEFCGEKCSAGTFGPNCISTCSKHCNQTCDYMNGTCDCLNGRQGSLCTECPHGKFGNVCTDNCSVACRSGACDPETGACTGCRDGMYGPECILACPSTCKLPKCDIDGSCTECNKGYYGTNCTLSCSRLCKDMDCNITTGACLECLTGQLPNCTACPKGLYGKNCNSSCPEFCQDYLCDIQIGQCFGCQGNRLLPLCKDLRYSADSQHFSVQNKVFWMVMALFSLTALMLFIFLSTRRSTPPRFENM